MQIRSGECSISVDPNPRGVWTDGDVVSGTVSVDIRREIEVSSVDVVLRCEERSQIMYEGTAHMFLSGPINSENIMSAHKVYYEDQCIVHPCPEEAQFMTNGESHRLRKGRHDFGFAFELPLPINSSRFITSYGEGRQIPPSVELTPVNGIYWTLTASVHRPALLKSDYRAVETIPVFPQTEPGWFHAPAKTTTRWLDMTAHLPGTKAGLRGLLDRDHRRSVRVIANLRVGQSLPQISPLDSPETVSLGLHLADEDDSGLVKLVHIKAELDQSSTTTVQHHINYYAVTQLLIDRGCNVEIGHKPTDISGLLKGAYRLSNWPKSIITETHDVRYSLRFALTLASTHRPGHERVLTTALHVDLLSPGTVFEHPPPSYPGRQVAPPKYSHAPQSPLRPEKHSKHIS